MEKTKDKSKDTKLQKKPNAFVYYTIGAAFSLMIKAQFNLHSKGVKPKGPAIILSNHTKAPEIDRNFTSKISALTYKFYFP